MKVFWPVSSNPPSTARAVVRMALRSLPAPGSVIASEPTTSPLAIWGRNSRFCASLPNSSR